MLQPGDRRVLREALRPPEGYVVDRAIATTYSLDLIALLIAPLSFSLFDRAARQGVPGGDDGDEVGATALLQAVRAHAERLTVYCQAGHIARTGPYRQLLAYLEGSVVEVNPPPPLTGVFHPKIWVLRFTSPTGPVRYRLLVNSRNLTFDRSWDTMLTLEGELKERTNAFTRNRPLSDFLAALPGLAVRPLPDGAKSSEVIADEVLRVAFEVPAGFDDDLVFCPQGHDGKGSWPFPSKIQRALVISPFVKATMLERLCASGSGHILISRSEELAALPPKALERFGSVHVLNEGAELEPEDGDVDTTGDDAATGLHAKVYVVDAGWDAHLWTGSANATAAAFSQNVEFLVRLTGKKSKVGIDTVVGETGGASLQALLVPYAPPATLPAINPTQEALDERLRRLRVQVASAPWIAHVETVSAHAGGEDVYRVWLATAGTRLDLGDGIRARCRPITLGVEYEANLALSPTEARASFERLSFKALTSFFAFTLEASEGDVRREVTFVVNACLQGAPADRQERLLYAMLADSAKVMRFLHMLLALDPLDALDELLHGGSKTASGAWSDTAEPPLFEALLQALDRQPARLSEFDRAIRDLRATPEGAKLLPSDLDLVWLPIREAWEASRGRR